MYIDVYNYIKNISILYIFYFAYTCRGHLLEFIYNIHYMKSLVFLLMLIGFVFITVGVVKSNQQCPVPKVQYRYIPQTFAQQQQVDPHLTATFKDMFEKDSPWLRSLDIHNQPKQATHTNSQDSAS